MTQPNNSFPLKNNERISEMSISVRSNDYDLAVKIVCEYFQKLGYQTAHAVGLIGEKNRLLLLTNILARNLKTNLDIACILTFPKRQSLSSRKILERSEKFLKYWKLTAVFLCYRKGTGEFPIIAKRVLLPKFQEKLRLFSLNLKTKEIDRIFLMKSRRTNSDQTKKEKSPSNT